MPIAVNTQKLSIAELGHCKDHHCDPATNLVSLSRDRIISDDRRGKQRWAETSNTIETSHYFYRHCKI